MLNPILNTMKTTPNVLSRQSLFIAILAACLVCPSLIQAAIFSKANNTSALNTAGSWVNNAVPGTGDIAQWDNNAATSTTNALGVTTSWGGVRIVNPGATVQIVSNNVLTNGVFGIDMSSATANLVFSNSFLVGPNAMEVWTVAPGFTLSFVSNLLAPSSVNNNTLDSGAVQVSTTGTVNLINATAIPLILNGQGNPWITYGLSDWAALNSSGNITNAAYTPATTAWVANVNPNDVQASFTNTATIDTTSAVRFNSPTPCIVTNTAAVTVTARGILVTPNSGGGAINGANLRPMRSNTAGVAFNVFQNSAATFTIGSALSVASSGTPVNLVKNGPGPLILTSTGNGTGGINANGGITINGGSLTGTVGGSLGIGFINVNNGNLIVNSGQTLANTSITVAGGATNTVSVTTANGQAIYTAPLTLNAGTTTLELLYGGGITLSPATPPLQLNGNFVVNGTVNVAVFNGAPAVGQYPLIKWTNTISSATFANFTLAGLPLRTQGYLSNNTANASIDLVLTNVNQPIVWNTGNGVWDINQTANWVDQLGATTTYTQSGAFGDAVLFSDAAPGPSINVTLNANPIPASVTVNNANNTYTISGSGGINGFGGLIKTGSGTLTLSTINQFTGGINMNGGTVIFTNISNLGAAGINFGGGTLQYNGNTDDISARVVVFNPGGGTINTAGQNINFATPVGNNSTGGLTKTGTGNLTLNGTNTYHGSTIINQGTVIMGVNSFLNNSAIIQVKSGAVLDTIINNVNLTLNTAAGQRLAGSGQVNGTVTAPASTSVSPATNGLTGTLAINGAFLLSGGTLDMDVSSSSNDLITVAGNLILNPGSGLQLNVIGTLPLGRTTLITYSGVLGGSVGNVTVTGFSQPNAVATLDSSVSGHIDMVVAASANDNLTWSGSGSTWDLGGSLDWLKAGIAWAYTNGDTVTFNDSASGNSSVALEAALEPASVTVSNTVVPTYTFTDGTGTGGGNITGTGSLTKDGTGTLIVQTANTYNGTTTIKNGTLQIGNGGIGDIGTGNVTNNASLVFAQGDAAVHNVSGVISGSGSLTESATATVVLQANNTYTGPTTISNGTVQVGTGGAAGSLGSNTSVTNNGSLILDNSGSVSFPYNITGSGALIDAGPATITLAGTLTYQGNTYISNGVVKLTANNQLPNTNRVAGSTGWLILDGGLTPAGTLDLNGFNLTANALAGALNTFTATITNSSTSTTTTNTLTVLSAANTLYDGQIMDHGTTGAKTALLVMGPGGNTNSLTLNPTNNNLFSGGLTISNSIVILGAGAGNGTVNINESVMAPGTGPITLLGTNTSLYTDGSQPGTSTTPTYTALTNVITIPAGQNVTVFGPNRGAFSSPIFGSGILNYASTYVRDSVGGNWAAFTGQVILSGNASGGNIGFTTTNGIPNAPVTITTNVAIYCTLTGATLPIGSLSGGDSSCQIESTNSGGGGGVPAIFAIGSLNQDTTYSGGIVDNVTILKVGTGRFTLNCGSLTVTNVTSDGFNTVTNVGFETNIVNYVGNTIVSNGVLAVVAPVILTNSTNVVLASAAAVLDASSMGYVSNQFDSDGVTLTNQFLITNSLFEVTASHFLQGLGTLNAILQADTNSIFNVGLPTGTFNITSNATLSGAVTMNLNTTDAPVCSALAAKSFTINGSATLLITNSGPGLTNGVSFTLFNHPVSGFASVVLPAADPTGTTNYVWANNLNVNGSITLTSGGVPPVSGVNTNPTNIVFSVSGGNLTLSWPPDHTGWTLLAQTNSLAVGVGTNWVAVPGSTSSNQIVIPINLTNGTVLYRLRYP